MRRWLSRSHLCHCAIILLIAFATADAASLKKPLVPAKPDVRRIDYTPHAPTFQIADTKEWFVSILTNNVKKSDFETIAEHQARIAAATPTNLVYLEVSTNLVQYKYYPAARRLVVWRERDFKITIRTNDPSVFLIDGFNFATGTTTLQNYYGAIFNVDQFVGIQYKLAITNFLYVPFPTGWHPDPKLGDRGIALPIDMDPGAAEETVENKHLTLVLGVTADDLSQAKYHLQSTRGEELINRRENVLVLQVPARVHYLGILNKKSGQILATWPHRHSE
jgi:hypothetical protein